MRNIHACLRLARRRGLTACTLGLILLTLLVPAPAQAQSGNVWRIDYFPNLAWAGTPVYTAYSNLLNFNWGANSPGPRVSNVNWTARMTSEAFFYAGIYRFTVVADDEFMLLINGVSHFSTVDRGQAGKAFVLDVPMSQGLNAIQIDFRQFGGTAYLTVDWRYVKQTAPPAPAPGPVNPQPIGGATSVVTQFGVYTPCIQQGLHQSYCFQASGAWDSPNLGSIEMEPPIALWGNCTANQIQTMQLFTGMPPQPAVCSRTEAGWFPR